MRATSSEKIQGKVETTLQSRTMQQQSPTSIPGSVELAVIIPTLNERENVSQLLERIDIALKGIKWEVIFVDDDSTDGTAQLVR
jgi:cellulose synthase/poly-beta-1,6-N-acetylglucosamine synthase-like glycosyltransferase